MTEIANNAPAEARSIETITAEIVAIRGHAARVVLESAIEIGRRLVEAKELLPHGEWGKWLKEKVDFSQDSATRLMNAYKGYADRQGSLFGAQLNSAALRNLSITNALLLLKVPEDEREEFAAEVDAEHISSRDLERIIKERDRALADAAAAAEREKTARAALITTSEAYEGKLQDAKAALEDTKAKLRQAETAAREPDPAEIRKQVDAAVEAAVKEARAAADADKKKLKAKLSAAEKAAEEARSVAERFRTTSEEREKLRAQGMGQEEKDRLEREIGDLKKQLAMADAGVAAFTTLFKQWGKVYADMMAQLQAITSDEARGKLVKALRFQLKRFVEVVGEEKDGEEVH